MLATSYLESVTHMMIAKVKIPIAIQELRLATNVKKILNVWTNMVRTKQSTKKKFVLKEPVSCATQTLTAQICSQPSVTKNRSVS